MKSSVIGLISRMGYNRMGMFVSGPGVSVAHFQTTITKMAIGFLLQQRIYKESNTSCVYHITDNVPMITFLL